MIHYRVDLIMRQDTRWATAVYVVSQYELTGGFVGVHCQVSAVWLFEALVLLDVGLLSGCVVLTCDK